ncbi:MAG: PEP-CTERM sorting domain-containing protein [Planctomycetota bacterium]
MKLSFTTRLQKYGALAVAGAAATAAVQTAEAAIVYSGVQNIAVPADFTGVYLDLDGIAFNTTGGVAGVDDYNIWYNGASQWDTFQNGSGGSAVIGVAAGSTIDGSLAWDPGLPDIPDGTELIAYQFSGGNFGWIRLSGVDSAAGTLTVVDWAFDDAGAAVQAGVVPEPGSLALLGLSGLALLRRRR